MKTIFTSLFVIISMTLFAQAGATDAGFNGNGKYRDIISYNRTGQINFQKVAIQPDGKIVMAGNSGAIQNLISALPPMMILHSVSSLTGK